MGGGASLRSRYSADRSGRGYDRLRLRTHRRSSGLELAVPVERPGTPRHPGQEGVRQAAVRRRRHAQDHGDPVRGQQQLVRGVRVLVAAAVWTHEREADEWRPREVGGGRASARDGAPQRAPRQLPGAEEGECRDPREAAGRGAGAQGEADRARGCPVEAGVRGRDHRAARDDGDRAARGPHPSREEHPLGSGRRARRYVQVVRRAAPALQGREGHRRQGRGHRVLSHRRALEPHVVRAQVPARRQEGAQLRRLVDRVGEPRGSADREGSGMKAAVEGGRRRKRAVEARTPEPALWGLVGNTPLIPVPPATALDRPLPSVFLKAEWLNPGGSVKDRAALFILRDGIARGQLPRKRLLDASSGNTAIAYAMLGAAVVFTDPLDGSDGAIRKARELAAARPEHYWYADQYNHPANARAHYVTTAEEIWRQTDGRITHFVAGLGTTDTMMGTGRRLKELNPEIELVAVQPDGPFHGLEGLKHLDTAIVPGIFDPAVPDRMEFVATEEADDAVRRLAREAGLFVGWSTGAAVLAAERVLSDRPTVRPSDAVVVVIAPDSGTRYLSEHRRLAGDSV